MPMRVRSGSLIVERGSDDENLGGTRKIRVGVRTRKLRGVL